MTAVLGIDLASARWTFNGSALLHFAASTGTFTSVAPGAITWPSPGTPLTPQALADAVHTFAVREDVGAVALDGPQAWRNPDTPAHAPGVGRRCEFACRTQGKTGVYPKAYPGTQFAWIDFCVRVFDALLARPGVRLAGAPTAGPVILHARASPVEHERLTPPASNGYVVLETFPTSTWRTSGLTPLPAKATRPDVQHHYDTLAVAFALPAVQVSSHDDLQAIVAALAGVGAVGGPVKARPHGEACWTAEHASGTRRVEGFIWDAMPGRPAPGSAGRA
jgi:hypothetical protein